MDWDRSELVIGAGKSCIFFWNLSFIAERMQPRSHPQNAMRQIQRRIELNLWIRFVMFGSQYLRNDLEIESI